MELGISFIATSSAILRIISDLPVVHGEYKRAAVNHPLNPEILASFS